MSAEYLSGVWLIVTLELRQRVRGVAWYVLLGVFVVLVGLVTLLVWLAAGTWQAGGSLVFSAVVFFVLLLATLVSPALSGNAINGDREAGTLATTQVTLIGTGQLILGKFLAAWITALAFLAAAVPFLVTAVLLGEVAPGTIVVSLLVLAAELGVIAAVGVGLSGILTRPLFSIVTTYLLVALLSLGTLISFGLLGTATQSTRTSVDRTVVSSTYDDETGTQTDVVCSEPTTSTYQTPRFDYYWWILAANPYVVLADAAPGEFDARGNTVDMFGGIAVAVRSAQLPPELYSENNYCNPGAFTVDDSSGYRSSQETYDSTVPSWFVGLGIHLLLGAGALLWAWRRTNTPARRLPTGSRIA
ncbi:ABC transporter permease [Cryobacterium sp. PAMC25264]|uniref:ABC transporter permease n=1 Tax=Cryobacterium sp. PAMC25264 TaxID=2861288 RepID=UPI001C634C8E|nr:ABC transporter permease [Cryobacterium sp. PAMC25264]QYF72174.1 ABC transporter permease [Cryobacterium sp. PAMC25264]